VGGWDYAAQITANMQDGLLFKAGGVISDNGAWVRHLEGEPHIGMWGAMTSAADNKTAIEAAINCSAAIYPTRARTLRIPQDVFSFSSLSIPMIATVFSFGENFWNGHLHCTDVTATPAISVLCQVVKMMGISLDSDVAYTSVKKVGVELDKGLRKRSTLLRADVWMVR